MYTYIHIHIYTCIYIYTCMYISTGSWRRVVSHTWWIHVKPHRRIVSNVWKNHITHMMKSHGRISQNHEGKRRWVSQWRVVSHVWKSHVTRMTESHRQMLPHHGGGRPCVSWQRVTSRVWRSHVTHMIESHGRIVPHHGGRSFETTSHVTRMKASCHTYDRVTQKNLTKSWREETLWFVTMRSGLEMRAWDSDGALFPLCSLVFSHVTYYWVMSHINYREMSYMWVCPTNESWHT